MGELSELRTRLEGSLERVEQLTDSLERAAAVVAAGDTVAVTPLLVKREEPELKQALASVEKLASREAELQPWLERFARAEGQLRSALLRRAAELGVSEGSSLELARLLERERVLYRGTTANKDEIWLLLGCGVVISWVFATQKPALPLLFWLLPAVVVVAVVSEWFSSPKLVVTPGLLRLGDEVVNVADVKVLHIKFVTVGKRLVGHFSVESPSGVVRKIQRSVGSVPQAFVEAVKQIGIEVRGEGINGEDVRKPWR